MKFVPSALLALTASLAFLSACSKKSDTPATGAQPVAGKIKLGFLVKQPEEQWFQFEWKGAGKAADQYGFELIKLGVPDGEKTLAALDNLASLGAQGFVICTPDVRLGPAIVSKARQNHLKVITVDDQLVAANGQFMTEVHYLGMSASQIGRAAGEALAAEMKQRGWSAANTGVCAVVFEELNTARERTDGAIAALKASGIASERIFKAPQKTTDIPGSFDAANILLTQQPGIKRWLICGMNDNAVLGAVRATEGRQIAPADVIGVGINGTDCIDELRKPKPTGFFGSMLVSAPQEGFNTAEMLYRWVKDGVEPPLDSRSVGIFISRANFEQILKREGIIP
jgi:L-arabinose transport system substrate-binding protein